MCSGSFSSVSAKCQTFLNNNKDKRFEIVADQTHHSVKIDPGRGNFLLFKPGEDKNLASMGNAHKFRPSFVQYHIGAEYTTYYRRITSLGEIEHIIREFLDTVNK